MFALGWGIERERVEQASTLAKKNCPLGASQPSDLDQITLVSDLLLVSASEYDFS